MVLALCTPIVPQLMKFLKDLILKFLREEWFLIVMIVVITLMFVGYEYLKDLF